MPVGVHLDCLMSNTRMEQLSLHLADGATADELSAFTERIVQHKSLQRLYVQLSDFDGEDSTDVIVKLLTIPTLTDLMLYECNDFDFDAVLRAVATCPKLESLWLPFATNEHCLQMLERIVLNQTALKWQNVHAQLLDVCLAMVSLQPRLPPCKKGVFAE